MCCLRTKPITPIVTAHPSLEVQELTSSLDLPVAGVPLENCLRILRDAETHLASSLDSVRQHVKLLESLQPPPPEGPSTDGAAAGCSHPRIKDETRPHLNSTSSPGKQRCHSFRPTDTPWNRNNFLLPIVKRITLRFAQGCREY